MQSSHVQAGAYLASRSSPFTSVRLSAQSMSGSLKSGFGTVFVVEPNEVYLAFSYPVCYSYKAQDHPS